MEQQLLRTMVADRDSKILELTKSVDDLILQTSRLKLKLTKTRHAQKTQQEVHQEHLHGMVRQRGVVVHRITSMEKELKHVGSLRMYREALEEQELFQNPKQTTNSCTLSLTSAIFGTNETHDNLMRVLRMQCQLCKAMHYIHILHNEVLHLQQSSQAQIDVLKRVIQNTMESKCNIELNLMNQIMAADVKRQEINKEYSALVQHVQGQVLEWKQVITVQEEETAFENESTSSRDDSLSCQSSQQDEEQEDFEEENPLQESNQQAEFRVLGADERRKIFEKRKNELMGAHLERVAQTQIMVE